MINHILVCTYSVHNVRVICSIKTKNKDCAAQILNIFKDVCMLWGTNLAPNIRMSEKFSDFGEL